MLENHVDPVDTKNICSSGKSSLIGISSPRLYNLERKSATTLDFLGLSTIVMLNSYNNNNHLVTLPVDNGLFIKYFITE